MPAGTIRKNSTKGSRNKKITQQCEACLFSPDNCKRCAYQQFLIDLLDHSLQILKALPEKS